MMNGFFDDLFQDCSIQIKENVQSTSDCLEEEVGLQSEDKQLFDQDQEDSFQVCEMLDHGSLSEIMDDIENPPSNKNIEIQLDPRISGSKIKSQNLENFLELKKNSNVIKKIGRILLGSIRQFEIKNRQNEGVSAMLKLFQQKVSQGRKKSDCMDRFSFSHLNALFFPSDPMVSRFNLLVARRIINSKLRKKVFESSQIKGKSKAIYLNTLKVSSLRLCNKILALRMQLSKVD